MASISTYITTYNSLFYQSILEQTIKHALLFSDEVVVSISENTTDGTQNLLDNLKSKYPIIKTYTYKDNYSNLQQDLADRRTFALKHCKSDYAILQDDDECIHEKYAQYIRQLPTISPETIAFRFNTIHFYRSYNHYQNSPNFYKRKIYMVKNIPEIKHGRLNTDLDNHVILNDYKNIYKPLDSLPSPKVINTPVTVYHYGHTRNDAVMLLKKYQQEIQWWGKDYWNNKEFPFKFDNPNNLPIFNETHPKYIQEMIDNQKYNNKWINEFTK